MPKKSGHDHYALYFNKEGKKNQKRNKGKLAKPTSAETLSFLEQSLNQFKEKYGKKAKIILVSQEMKDMVDARVKGKGLLKGTKLIVTKEKLGLRLIKLSELKEEL